ncbi:hypothetical protein BG004_006949 [Podila humilis]|nr:hypothetical protein BG004_006949 [Podila humilis]
MESNVHHKAISNQLVVHTIASYLTPPDLAKCRRLCRFWQEEFEPYFFRNIVFKGYIAFDRLMKNNDAVKVLRQNMHHVREVDCTDCDISPLIADYPLSNLTCLRMSILEDYETNLLPLLKNSPRMHTLGLVLDHCKRKFKIQNMVNDITHHLPSLRCLDLQCKMELSQAAFAQILCLAAGLEIVRLNFMIRSKHDLSPSAVAAAASSSSSGGDIVGVDPQRILLNTFSETIALKATRIRIHDDHRSSALSLPLKELHFAGVVLFDKRDSPLFITFLSYCHRLEKLALPRICANRNDQTVLVFYLDLLSACVNTLQYLDVYGSYASGKAIAAVILKCASLRGFRWGYSQRDSELVYNALVARHRTSLEDIDVSGTCNCPHLTTATSNGLTMHAIMHRILCSFPRLRRFEASGIETQFWYTDHSISSTDLKDSSGCFKDWVCNDLKTISLRFIPGNTYAWLKRQSNALGDCEANRRAPIFPEVLCTQLCRLEKLEELRLTMDVNLGTEQGQGQEDEEVVEDDDLHMSTREALSNIQRSLKNLRVLELGNMSDFFDKSELDKHPQVDLVISRKP